MEDSDALITVLSESVCADHHRLSSSLNLGLRGFVINKILVKLIFAWNVLYLIFEVLLESIILGLRLSKFFSVVKMTLSLGLFLDGDRQLFLLIHVIICLSVHRRHRNILSRHLKCHLLIRGRIRSPRLVDFFTIFVVSVLLLGQLSFELAVVLRCLNLTSLFMLLKFALPSIEYVGIRFVL